MSAILIPIGYYNVPYPIQLTSFWFLESGIGWEPSFCWVFQTFASHAYLSQVRVISNRIYTSYFTQYAFSVLVNACSYIRLLLLVILMPNSSFKLRGEVENPSHTRGNSRLIDGDRYLSLIYRSLSRLITSSVYWIISWCPIDQIHVASDSAIDTSYIKI